MLRIRLKNKALEERSDGEEIALDRETKRGWEIAVRLVVELSSMNLQSLIFE